MPLYEGDSQILSLGPSMRKLSDKLPLALSLLLALGLVDAALLAIQFWSIGPIFDSRTSGVWTALAFDFSQGHLYRPLVSEDGYGGTRYVPLFFMFHGTLIASGLNAITAGVVAMQVSVVAMLAALVLMMRMLKVPLALTIGLALVTYCTTIYQQYLSDVNCEYLAAGLSLLGLAAFHRPDWRIQLVIAPLICTLAFFTKFSSLYVPAAIVFYLIFKGEFRRAAAFSMIGLAFVGGFFLIFQQLSQQSMWINLTSAATGGTDWAYASGFLSRFLTEVFVDNPAIGVTSAIAAIAFVVSLRHRENGLIAMTFFMVLLSTVVTYASRGISGNHVIALHAFSLLMIGAGARHLNVRAAAAGGFLIMAVIVFVTWLPGVPSPRATLAIGERETGGEIIEAVARHRRGEGPLLSDHGGIPALMGERAFLMDQYNLNNFLPSRPKLADDFVGRIESRTFSAIVLVRGSTFALPDGKQSVLDDNYVLAERVGRFDVFAPR